MKWHDGVILMSEQQLDITDDGFLSLMSDDGSQKEDVKVPDGDVGDKITKLFTDDGKDTSKAALRHQKVKGER